MYIGEGNQFGQIWDGKNWQTIPHETQSKDKSNEFWTRMMLRQITIGREYEEFNCHQDGVFKCPRCRRTHYLYDNYDLLCDLCSHISEESNYPVATEIKKWNSAKMGYHKKSVSDDELPIANMIEYRKDIRNLLECSRLYTGVIL